MYALWREVVHDVQYGLVREVSEAGNALERDVLDEPFADRLVPVDLSETQERQSCKVKQG